jgi:hypothetical protein
MCSPRDRPVVRRRGGKRTGTRGVELRDSRMSARLLDRAVGAEDVEAALEPARVDPARVVDHTSVPGVRRRSASSGTMGASSSRCGREEAGEHVVRATSVHGADVKRARTPPHPPRSVEERRRLPCIAVGAHVIGARRRDGSTEAARERRARGRGRAPPRTAEGTLASAAPAPGRRALRALAARGARGVEPVRAARNLCPHPCTNGRNLVGPHARR